MIVVNIIFPNLCCESPLTQIHFSSCVFFSFFLTVKDGFAHSHCLLILVQCCSPFLEKSRSALISRYPEAQLSIFCLCGVCSWPPGASPPALALQQASRSSSASRAAPFLPPPSPSGPRRKSLSLSDVFCERPLTIRRLSNCSETRFY